MEQDSRAVKDGPTDNSGAPLNAEGTQHVMHDVLFNGLVTADELETFVETSQHTKLQTTSAQMVYFKPNLYNVVGSTNDPKHVPGHKGEAWKQLLISLGVSSSSACYVTGDKILTHPQFRKGGHVTSRSDGKVPNGGKCYLMPICDYHNSTARDGEEFSHIETKMLELSGYMVGESALTFTARLASKQPYSLIYSSDPGWRVLDVASADLHNVGMESMTTPFILIERSEYPMGECRVVRSTWLA